MELPQIDSHMEKEKKLELQIIPNTRVNPKCIKEKEREREKEIIQVQTTLLSELNPCCKTC